VSTPKNTPELWSRLRPSSAIASGEGATKPAPRPDTPRYPTSETHQLSGVFGRGAGGSTTPPAPCHPGVPRCEKNQAFSGVGGWFGSVAPNRAYLGGGDVLSGAASPRLAAPALEAPHRHGGALPCPGRGGRAARGGPPGAGRGGDLMAGRTPAKAWDFAAHGTPRSPALGTAPAGGGAVLRCP
jgi:hypothetical protein